MKIAVLCDKRQYLDEWLVIAPQLLSAFANLDMVSGLVESPPEEAAEAHVLLLVLDPEHAGDWRLLEYIRAHARRAKRLFFALNEKERFTAQQRKRLQHELVKALPELEISDQLLDISVTLARLSYAQIAGAHWESDESFDEAVHCYRHVEQQEQLPNAEGLLAFSGMTELISRLMSFEHQLKLLEEAGLSDAQSTLPICLFVSNRAIGKSLLREVLSQQTDKWAFAELSCDWECVDENDLFRNADVICFVTDSAYAMDLPHVLPYLTRPNTYLVLNRSDEFALSGQEPQRGLSDCIAVFRKQGIAPGHVILTSAYYARLAYALQATRISIDELVGDSQVVLTDHWGLPLPKQLYKDRLQDRLAHAHGIDAILTMLRGVQHA
jgi:hypothetical protein